MTKRLSEQRWGVRMNLDALSQEGFNGNELISLLQDARKFHGYIGKSGELLYAFFKRRYDAENYRDYVKIRRNRNDKTM